MFTVYAVRVINSEKHRHFMGAFGDLPSAKHLANCATCGNADYAYVKETGGHTVFYIDGINPAKVYPEVPLQQTRPIGPTQ